MKSYVSLVLLLRLLASHTAAEDGHSLDPLPIRVLNVTVANSSLVYPDVLVILPLDYPRARRVELMDQLGVGESPDNSLADSDVTRGVDAVLSAAAPLMMAMNNTGTNLTQLWIASDSGNTASHHVYAVVPTMEEELIRKRRSLLRLQPLSRKKRTLKKHSCKICEMLQPKQPIVINVYKQGGCNSGCGEHYQPPPVYHPPPQTCDPCSRQPTYQQPYHQPYHQPYQQPYQQPYHQPSHQPYQQQPSGSWSHSQSSASSSSGSWGKK